MENILEPYVIINKDSECLDKKYLPNYRTWQAIATIESSGKRLWASWMSGGLTEPDVLNHIILAYSDDLGQTWVDPFIIVDFDGDSLRGRDPVLWMNRKGELNFYYGFGGKTYNLLIENPEDDINKLIIHDQKIVFDHGMILNKPIEYDDFYLCMYDPYDKKRKYSYNLCMRSDDLGQTWYNYGKLKSHSKHKWFQEGTIVEKKDHSLFALTRIEQAYKGGLEATTSKNGKRWKVMKNNQCFPFYGPGTKCYLRRLKSGALFFINNNSNTKWRKNMSAYLSFDDGITWKSLLIDYRVGCAYPDATEDKYGNIFVIFDSGRKTRNEIRVSMFTEKEIVSGKYDINNPLRLKAISKDPKYRDILDANIIDDNLVEITLSSEKITLSYKKEEMVINNNNYVYYSLGDELENNLITDPYEKLLKKIDK